MKQLLFPMIVLFATAPLFATSHTINNPTDEMFSVFVLCCPPRPKPFYAHEFFQDRCEQPDERQMVNPKQTVILRSREGCSAVEISLHLWKSGVFSKQDFVKPSKMDRDTKWEIVRQSNSYRLREIK